MNTKDFMAALEHALTLYRVGEYNGTPIIVDHQGFPATIAQARELLDVCKSHLSLGEQKLLKAEKLRWQLQEERQIDLFTEKKSKNGFVYVMKSDASPLYKIGLTTRPEERLKQIQEQALSKVDFVFLVQSDDIVRLEVELHRMFSEKRVRGEWFELTPHDIEQIKSYCDRSTEVAS